MEKESGNLVQKEYAGTESKSETEKLLRKAMEDYEEKKFVAKTENITLGEMLDIWLEEEVKPGTLSTGTLIAYTTTARQIKKHPIGQRKLKSITADHLQEYIDFVAESDSKHLIAKYNGKYYSFRCHWDVYYHGYWDNTMPENLKRRLDLLE